jgi:DUF438 domain-containing protein
MRIFKEMCDKIKIRIGYADENLVSQWFNKAFLDSGKRKEEDLGKSLRDCHNEQSIAKIDFMHKEFLNGRTEPFVLKMDIEGDKTIIYYHPIFLDGVFKGIFETIFYPDELMEGFPYPGEFSFFNR